MKFWGNLAALLLLLASSWAQEPSRPFETARRSTDDAIPRQTENSETETTLVFPDYVDGGGWSVQLALSNVDPAAATEVRVEVYDPDGHPVLDLFDSDLMFEIPSLGSRVLRSTGSGAIRRGWIEVQTDSASVSGLLTYRDTQSGIEVSVEPVELGQHFALFVEESPTIGAGVAVYKPDVDARVELRIRDEEGNDPLEGGIVRWGDFRQAARTLPEWFDDPGVDTAFLGDFRGLLFLRSEGDSPFAPLGLRFGKGTFSLSAVPVIRILDRSRIDGGHTSPHIYNDNVFVLPVAENLAALWTDFGDSPPLEDYTARFYEHFNDEFDFLIFFANVRRREIELEPGSYDGAFFNHVKNDVQGIGLDTFSDNSNWVSAGKLQGVIFSSVYEPYHPIFEDSDFRQGQLLHELMHQWANFIIPNTSSPLHWGLSSPGGVLGDDISNLIDLGDGKFSAIDIRRVQFSPIELYLAGFIPPEDVPDFQIAEDAEWLPPEIVEDDKGRIRNFMFTASGIKTYTIEDIIAEHGPRVPGHLQAQKDFRAAVILLVSEDYPATREILESVSDDVLWFSHAGEVGLEKGHWPVPNFYEASGGRGTITMDGLSQFQSRTRAKRLAPSSFGTGPLPIVDLKE